jgi:hypothetical protein
MTTLSVRFNVAVLQIAARLFPTGFDVSDTAPDTFDKLKSHVEQTGRMLVWNGASDATIFGDPEVNYAFRAWHDWCHLAGNHPFTPEGERGAANLQIQHIREIYGYTADANEMVRLIDAEVNGQVTYHEHHNGDFPADQVAFVKHYLVNPFAAVVMDY